MCHSLNRRGEWAIPPLPSHFLIYHHLPVLRVERKLWGRGFSAPCADQTLHYPECLLNGDGEAEDRAMASSDPFVSPHHVEELDKGWWSLDNDTSHWTEHITNAVHRSVWEDPSTLCITYALFELFSKVCFALTAWVTRERSLSLGQC